MFGQISDRQQCSLAEISTYRANCNASCEFYTVLVSNNLPEKILRKF